MEQGNTPSMGESAALSALRSEEMQKKFAAAVNPSTPARILADLAEGSPTWIQERVAENPSTPQEFLSKLAQHCCSTVRTAVADNASTVHDIIVRLVNDESADVRYAIAENHSMPALVLEALTEDENPYVAFRARKTLLRLAENKILEGRFSIITKPLKGKRVQFG
ncbi:MAG: hypothetical protein C0507_01030 [Cyanobacteria bacterium PR.3.49]|nr:hypothetical protein [Cyanobacteria bacterium PR.3.49]